MKKMYLILRMDLATNYLIGQGAHALAAFAMEHPEEFKEWDNSTIACLGVRNVWALREEVEGIKYSNENSPTKIQYSIWKEEDQGGMPTALACYVDSSLGSFKRLPPV